MGSQLKPQRGRRYPIFYDAILVGDMKPIERPKLDLSPFFSRAASRTANKKRG
jgi:hypothetical protein